MSVSGAQAVAAYPAGELSGDRAALFRLELSRALGTAAGVSWNGSVLTDHGWAATASPVGNADAERYLAGVGMSLGASVSQGGFFKLFAVRRTSGGAPTSEPYAKTRLLAQAGIVC